MNSCRWVREEGFFALPSSALFLLFFLLSARDPGGLARIFHEGSPNIFRRPIQTDFTLMGG